LTDFTFTIFLEILPVKRLFFFFALLLTLSNANGQASVSYYPWNGMLGISTNPRNVVWMDARVQTNSLFSSLSIDLLPLVNLRRGEVVQWYIGGGIRVNPLYRIADPKADLIKIDGYSLNFGARVSPLAKKRNIQVVLELSPFAKNDWASGVLRSNFGLAYIFGKKAKSAIQE
jgi:hypothetical protein